MDISTVLIFIKQVMATLMTLLMMMSPAFGGTGVPYRAEKPEELVTSFAVASDIHVETNNPETYRNFYNVLEGIKAGQDIDAVVYTGDNVMNGQLLENFFFYTAIRAEITDQENIVVAGNHDLGNTEGDFEQLRKNFIMNNNFYLGNRIDREYYYKVINGCYMIVLCSEDLTSWEFTISETQYNWLVDVLDKAKADDAPVFVFNHYPIRFLNTEKGSFISAEQFGDLLVNYGVELFVHGHIHDDVDGPENFYNSYGVDCINLGRITENVNYEPGNGIVVEVYEDEFIVRTRNFVKGEWNEDLRYVYAVK